MWLLPIGTFIFVVLSFIFSLKQVPILVGDDDNDDDNDDNDNNDNDDDDNDDIDWMMI